MSAELDNIKAQYGIQPTVSGGYSGDPQDLPVYIAMGPAGPAKKQGILATASGAPWSKIVDATTGRRKPQPTTKLSSQMEKDFYSMDRQERATLQKRLHAGGFYGNTDPNSIILGIPDETSFKAYSTAVGRAAAYFNAGQRKTLDDVLDEAAGIQAQMDAAGGGSGGGRGGGSGNGSGRAPLTVGLTNPEDLRYVVQRTATSTLGRALNDDEVKRFVASFQGMEGQAQGAAYNVAETGGTATAAPSATAAADAFARQADPTAAGGNDFLKVFQSFSDLLGRE